MRKVVRDFLAVQGRATSEKRCACECCGHTCRGKEPTRAYHYAIMAVSMRYRQSHAHAADRALVAASTAVPSVPMSVEPSACGCREVGDVADDV